MERLFAAIMAADVVGYSRMMGADEAGTLARVKAWLAEIFNPAIETHGGRIVKLMGDGALVMFPEPVKAVACGLRLQRLSSSHAASKPDEHRIVARVGINLGEVIVENGDIFGDEVNITARLEGMAPPGGLLISQAVWSAIEGRLDARFHDNGPRKFKNISRAIAVWSWPDKLPSARADQKPRVHLQPFAGSILAEQQLAADLGDAVRSHLSTLTGLEVAGASDNVHFRVEGGVRLASGRCRVHARLISVEGDRQIWAERYDEATDDPLAVVDACAPRIVMSLRRQVAAEDAARLRNRPLDELSANELLALGGASFFNPTLEGWRGGGVLAEQALQVAPGSFMALAMAAAGFGLARPLYTHTATPEPVLELAFNRIEEAVRRNNRSDMLYAVHCGLLLYGRGRYREAEAAARRSLEINPDYNMGLWMLGAVQVFGGDPGAACTSAERAVALNGADPYVHLYSRVAGYSHLAAGRFETAVEWFGRADQMAPGIVPNLMALAVTLQRMGDKGGAADAIDRLMRAEPALQMSHVNALPFADPAAWNGFAKDLRAAGVPP